MHRRVMWSLLPLAIATSLVHCDSGPRTPEGTLGRSDEPLVSHGPVPKGHLTATVQGVRISWPKDWTLIQLEGETADGSWPTLQLTNYPVDLDDPLCPGPIALPPDGVLLYVEWVRRAGAATLPESPAQASLSEAADGTCGVGRSVVWQADEASLEGRVLVGPDASRADEDRLLASLRGLRVEREGFVDAETWHPDRERQPPFDVMIEEPKYVVAMRENAGFPEDSWLLVPPQGDVEQITILYVDRLGSSGTALDIEPYDPFHFAGDTARLTVDDSPVVVRSIGYAALDVDRVVLLADDGREIEVALGPSLARYGVDFRPTFVRFEAPLLGYWVALDEHGDEIKRHRYRNWPSGYP